jgi:Rps23 Pro-64 3,4-dihydroxylase Tpa1-like proline 4-hydroxylase
MMNLNPAIAPEALATDLAGRGRLQIRDFLVAEDAERVFTMLRSQTPWWVVYNEGDKVEQLPPEYFANLSGAQVNQMLVAINERAKKEYQFLYQFYPLVSMYFTPTAPKLPILEVFETLNSPPALDFFRKLTGRADIQWLDAQATLYRPGHFLKSHSDLDPDNNRVAAYVLNFTKLWERDWGGYLQFFNDDHDIEYALRPIFNALNVFNIPTDHSVGVVSPFANGMRFSVTGWMRSDPPPGPFGQLAGD